MFCKQVSKYVKFIQAVRISRKDQGEKGGSVWGMLVSSRYQNEIYPYSHFHPVVITWGI